LGRAQGWAILGVRTFVSEGTGDYQPIPGWIDFAIQFGYRWISNDLRKIAVISMPCDTAAAALIALGALIRDLGRAAATNVGNHSEAIERYARQYIEFCSKCTVRCKPEIRLCGYAAEATGFLRYKGAKYRILGSTTCFGEDGLVLSRDGGTWIVFNKRFPEFQIDGEPPSRLSETEPALSAQPYLEILGEARVLPSNLRESYSGLCLAGRSAGKTSTREAYAAIHFGNAETNNDLPRLLTIREWSRPATVSRAVFFNPRTENLESRQSSVSLVIADGDVSFLRILNRREFQRADIIGVFHRTIERNNLELIGNRIAHLRQWYEDDLEVSHEAPKAPRGIGVIILKQKVS
jgi:hypothetical protein